MQKFNPLAATLVIAVATATVGAYCYFFPERAIETIIIYLATIVFLPLLVLLLAWTQKNKMSNLIKPEVAENLNTEMIIWSDDFSYVFLNKKLRTLLGISENDSNKKAAVWKAFGINAPDSKGFEKIVGSKSYETKFKNANGTMTSIAWSTSLVKKSKKRCLYLSTGFNLTEIKKMKVNLASANDFFNSSMELAEIGIIISTDRKKYIASSELMRMLGLKSNSLSLNDFRALVHPNDRMAFDSAIKSASSEIKSIEMRIKSADTSFRWYSYRYKSIKGTDNTLPLFGGALLDSTQEHEKDALIERLAYIDEVTEIANRNKLINAGQEIYETCRLLNYSYWIIVLDIDRFHIINDTCGYNNGNYVLRNFAHILYKFVTPGGLAARISGDNFALILRDYGSDELPVRTVKSIQEEFAKLAVDELASINLSCSAGFSKMPEDGKSFLEVIEHAEFALKSGGVNQSSIYGYEPSMHDSIISTTEMEKAIALALDNNEFSLYYQPKIDLSTGRLMGVEALIRWIKPDGTVVPPDAFVPVAERSRLIGRITEFVLNEGCRQNVLWQKMGFPKIVVSINFTSSDFYQNDLKDRVLDSLIKSGLEPQWLEIELTESLALNDIDFAVSQMNKLRELGVKLAMDDFGTGYSSLSYLQTLPITLLKLDRSFITDIEHNNIAYEIVASVIRIAKSKKIETIAEGIENTVQQSILRMAGCDYAQGFLYGKPMPPEQLQRFFEQNLSDLRN
ncbi:MAG: GGDEF domain-containing protein [Ruminococcus sp.]|nr:GGDEF domain-containing protein [Ruminococcus sp.]